MFALLDRSSIHCFPDDKIKYKRERERERIQTWRKAFDLKYIQSSLDYENSRSKKFKKTTKTDEFFS